MQLWLVLGTSTEVGKTWVSCKLLERLRATGRRAVARKPAQSFDPADAAAQRTDAHLLAAAGDETPEAVCPPDRWYERAMAPPMAAEALGRSPFRITDLVAELAWPGGLDIGIVEAAGGVRSPLALDGDGIAFAAALSPDRILLVADAGLGTLNAVRLSVDALAGAMLDATPPTIVLLNRFVATDPLQVANRDWLVTRDRFDVVTSPEAALAALFVEPER